MSFQSFKIPEHAIPEIQSLMSDCKWDKDSIADVAARTIHALERIRKEKESNFWFVVAKLIPNVKEINNPSFDPSSWTIRETNNDGSFSGKCILIDEKFRRELSLLLEEIDLAIGGEKSVSLMVIGLDKESHRAHHRLYEAILHHVPQAVDLGNAWRIDAERWMVVNVPRETKEEIKEETKEVPKESERKKNMENIDGQKETFSN